MTSEPSAEEQLAMIREEIEHPQFPEIPFFNWDRTVVINALWQALDACRAELAAAVAREAKLREALQWYFRARHHTRQHCPYRQSIGEWCNQCEREPSDMALLAEPDTTNGEASQ